MVFILSSPLAQLLCRIGRVIPRHLRCRGNNKRRAEYAEAAAPSDISVWVNPLAQVHAASEVSHMVVNTNILVKAEARRLAGGGR